MPFKTFTCLHCKVESGWTSLDCPECGKAVTDDFYEGTSMNTYTFHHETNGLAVAAGTDIPARHLVETSPAYLQSIFDFRNFGEHVELDCGRDEKTNWNHMALPWFFDDQRALLLGKGLLFNHSFEPNCSYWFREDKETGRYFMDFFTLRDVRENEELTISYGNQIWWPPYTREAWEREKRIKDKRIRLEAEEEAQKKAR